MHFQRRGRRAAATHDGRPRRRARGRGGRAGGGGGGVALRAPAAAGSALSPWRSKLRADGQAAGVEQLRTEIPWRTDDVGQAPDGLTGCGRGLGERAETFGGGGGLGAARGNGGEQGRAPSSSRPGRGAAAAVARSSGRFQGRAGGAGWLARPASGGELRTSLSPLRIADLASSATIEDRIASSGAGVFTVKPYCSSR
ncbi:hypothetical protein C2845_PM01G31130 [Panicum miliaceum]|uniref:Uncharacterized protein n=1 Tax=Panicum miliaceum TaxID=4540 RepID=A0A3L6TRF0_PANMI|nr:hypothetical protein C2845_PM01G31130 [Panicum miliaceum]